MELPRELPQMGADQLRALAIRLSGELAERDSQLSAQDAELLRRAEELKRKQLKIDQLTHEIATLNRWRYAKRSEQLDAVQCSMLDESIDADIEAISLEIEALQEKMSTPKAQPRRVALLGTFPWREVRHEPEHTQMQLWRPARTHRRGCERETGLHPRCVPSRAPHPRKMGVSPV